jgi:MFS family permease
LNTLLGFTGEIYERVVEITVWVAIVTSVVALAAIPAWATLSDRIGRKPVFIFGAVGS